MPEVSITPDDIAKWVPVFRSLPVWWQIVIVVALTAVGFFSVGWALANKYKATIIATQAATIEHLKIVQSTPAKQIAPESWARLDAIKRGQIANVLRVLKRSEVRMFDVFIQSLPHSDCRDLAVDLSDAIQEAGLTAALIDDVSRRNIDPGIWIEGNRTDPIFQKLIEAFAQADIRCQLRNVDGYMLNLRIGRRP
jgi:hypothetical protein